MRVWELIEKTKWTSKNMSCRQDFGIGLLSHERNNEIQYTIIMLKLKFSIGTKLYWNVEFFDLNLNYFSIARFFILLCFPSSGRIFCLLVDFCCLVSLIRKLRGEVLFVLDISPWDFHIMKVKKCTLYVYRDHRTARSVQCSVSEAAVVVSALHVQHTHWVIALYSLNIVTHHPTCSLDHEDS